MKYCVVTSDKTKWIMPLFERLWNKYWGEKLTVIQHNGSIKGWCNTLYDYFSGIKDEYIFFTLDDYLPTGFNKKKYDSLTFNGNRPHRWELGRVSDYVRPWCHGNWTVVYDQRSPYRISCQPSIWKRDYLLSFLERNSTPWEFEVHGTKQSWSDGAKIVYTKPPVYTSVHAGALSNRWKGYFHIGGINPDDKDYVIEFATKHGYKIKD